MRRSCVFVSLGLCAACLDAPPETLPGGSGLRVLAHQGPDETWTGYVLAPGPTRIALPREGAWLLDFDMPARTLLLDEDAPLPALRDEAPAQPLPEPAVLFTSTADGWAEESPSALPAPIMIPRVTLERCLALGGCLSTDEAATCNFDCTPPAPRAPAPPRRPCPAGWVQTAYEEGPPTCKPPEPIAVECPADARLPVDGAACEPLGPCAAEWPNARETASAVLHVRPGASGDGSPSAPYGSIAEALATAPAGADVLLSTGRHDGAVDVDVPGLRVVGVCAGLTTWHIERAARIDAMDVRFEGLRLQASTSTAVQVASGATLVVTSARIDGAVDTQGTLHIETSRFEGTPALHARGGRVDLDESEVRGDVRASAGAQVFGTDVRSTSGGLSALGAARIELRRTRFEHATTGIAATAVDRLLLEDVTVLGDTLYSGATLETGVPPAATASVTITRLAVFGARGFGLVLRGGAVDLQDLYMRLEGRGRGVYITEEPYVPMVPPMRLRGVWLEGGIEGHFTQTRDRNVQPELRVTVEDLVVRGAPTTEVDTDPSVLVGRDLRLVLRRAYLESHAEEALNVNCASALIEDLTVTGRAKIGVELEPATFGSDESLRLEARRITVRGEYEEALHTEGSDSCPRLPSVIEDLDVLGCESCRVGIGVTRESRLDLTRGRVQGFSVGVEVPDRSTLRFVGGRISGNALGARFAASVDATDALRDVDLTDNDDPLAH